MPMPGYHLEIITWKKEENKKDAQVSSGESTSIG